jgi:adenosylcobinamide-phosphate synthase
MVTPTTRRATPAGRTVANLTVPAALAAALVLDRALGEPPGVVHPVARFGQAMEAVERRVWVDRRARGAVYAAGGVGAAALAGGALGHRGGVARVWVGLVVATYVAVAGRALESAAEEVEAALAAGDLAAARDRVRALVGRDVSRLDEAEVVRAVVESLAENTVDAVTAPLVWAAVAGAPGVLAYRAVNTLDAMVGHRSPRYERFGWAAARADDAANWVPARVTALAVAAVRPRRGVAVLRAVRSQAPAHPSPNAGVVEAAFAAALGVTLGGVNGYEGRTEGRPLLGCGPAPERRHIAAAIRLSRAATVAVWAATALRALATGRVGA